MKKLVRIPSTYNYKKYGTINITPDLTLNTWYTLDNIPQKIEQSSTYTSDKHELTNQKYSLKKEVKKNKLFMIEKITPHSLLSLYKIKNNVKICKLSESALAYMMLYAGKSNLVFDNAKGLLLYSCLYFTNNATTDTDRYFEILRCYDKEYRVVKEDDLVYINTTSKSFDTVFMIGQDDYKSFINAKKHYITNLLLIYFNSKEEACVVFEYLINSVEFVDVSLMDFFAREWKIDSTVRPEMRCDLENGYVVRATRIFSDN